MSGDDQVVASGSYTVPGCQRVPESDPSGRGHEVVIAENFEGMALTARIRGLRAAFLFVEYNLGGNRKPGYPLRSKPLGVEDLDRAIDQLTLIRDQLRARIAEGWVPAESPPI